MDPSPSPASISWTLPIDEAWGIATPPTFPLQADPERALQTGHFLKVVFNRTPDPRLHAAMVLRRGWIVYESPQNVQQKELEVVARLLLPLSGQQAHLAIESTRLARDIAPGDWLKLYLATQKVAIVAGRQWLTAGGVHEERLGLIKTLGEPWVTRLVALKDGDRIYLLRAWCTLSMYESLAEELVLAWQTFELLEPTGAACAEKLLEQRLTVGEAEAATLLRAFSPASWKVGRPAWETPSNAPVPIMLEDPDSGARLCLGLQPRAQDETSALVLRDVLMLWAEPTLHIQADPVIQGPYNELQGEVTGQYFELNILPEDSSDSESAQPPSPAAPPAPAATPWRMRGVVAATHFAWAWVLWRPVHPDTDPAIQAVDRRAFELILLYLQLTHPALVPPQEEATKQAERSPPT